jgi:hypothetical protein
MVFLLLFLVRNGSVPFALKHITLALVLAFLDHQQPFDVKINTSQYALGIVLKHKRYPMAYHNILQGNVNL